MTPYKHLLCPIDFSEISRVALEWTLAFGKEMGSDVTLLHAIDTALMNVGNLVAVPGGADELRRSAKEQLEAWKRDFDLSAVRLEIAEGVPTDTIVAAAKQDEVDLVVMGTHGLSGIQKLLLGSVMEKVLHRIHIPLLAMPPRTGDAKSYDKPKNILLAVDFGPESNAVVRHGVWLAEHYGSKLTAAHAVPIPYVVLNDRSMERLTPQQLESLKKTLTSDRREELESLLPAFTGVPTDVVSSVGSSFQALTDLMAERDIDLVVMGAGGHRESGWGWVGSTCHKMVRSASCPVLIVR